MFPSIWAMCEAATKLCERIGLVGKSDSRIRMLLKFLYSTLQALNCFKQFPVFLSCSSFNNAAMLLVVTEVPWSGGVWGGRIRRCTPKMCFWHDFVAALLSELGKALFTIWDTECDESLSFKCSSSSSCISETLTRLASGASRGIYAFHSILKIFICFMAKLLYPALTIFRTDSCDVL